ncbi:MAG TPA: GlsB/YeaQ/YmgE family stress response membrane protein [Bacillota bacterium]|nr:GlsB/YeaQ/YmgE family stress response membrane protein [Bacillota bacterium]
MNLVVIILIGLGIGVMVELLLPGHTPSELVLAMFLGVAGALLAHYVGQWGGWFDLEDPASFIAAALGAIIFLLLYGAVFRRRRRSRRQ